MSDLAAATAALLRGGVVLLPTDTIYGLHALATDAAAIDRLVRLKGRDGDKPFVVIGATMEQLETLGIDFPLGTRRALEEIWPGPLTGIFSLRQEVPASRGARTLAIRVPAVEWLRELLLTTGPLASTSANASGEAPVAHPAELSRALRDQLDAVVDRGRLEGNASTIVDFAGDQPRLVRGGNTFFTQKLWKSLRKSL